MISFSEPRAVVERRRLVELGHSVHRAVVEEGRREGVFAYLYHWQDERGEWRARFEKYDRRTGLVCCRFSPGLAARIRANADAVRAYVRWLDEGRAAPGVGSDGRPNKPTPNWRGGGMGLTNEKRGKQIK